MMEKQKSRFSLIEMIVVMSIIVILIAIIASATGYLRAKSLRSRTRAQMAQIEMALEQYKSVSGFLPEQGGASPTDSDLELKVATIEGLTDELGKPYLKISGQELFASSTTVILDAYGNPFFYQHCTGTSCSSKRMNKESYDLWSMGPDGKQGDGGSDWTAAMTAQDNDDITNWKND